MKARIKALNAAYEAGEVTLEEYQSKAKRMLNPLDWQKRIKYVNLLYISL